MAVYVDDANIPASVRNGSRVHTSRWCHLTADTREELLAMAARLRLRPEWIQRLNKSGEHFDLTEPKRAQAVRFGAVEITRAEAVEQMRCQRDGRPFDLAALRTRNGGPFAS